jgi:hypothetical protein
MIKMLIVIGVMTMVACSDTFRYPCQDPKNHHKAECNPPACEADGTCTKYLLKDEDEN